MQDITTQKKPQGNECCAAVGIIYLLQRGIYFKPRGTLNIRNVNIGRNVLHGKIHDFSVVFCVISLCQIGYLLAHQCVVGGNRKVIYSKTFVQSRVRHFEADFYFIDKLGTAGHILQGVAVLKIAYLILSLAFVNDKSNAVAGNYKIKEVKSRY